MIDKRLKKIFINILNIETDIIEMSEIDNTSEWDSLGHIRLISEIEEEFGIQLEASEISEFVDYESIKHIILKHIE